jgi:hypothetical protein
LCCGNRRDQYQGETESAGHSFGRRNDRCGQFSIV